MLVIRKFNKRSVGEGGGFLASCWSGEVFKKISGCYGGFLEVDEETKRFSQLQWARILVKTGGKILWGLCI